MTALLWGKVGEKLWETGVDHGVLFLRDVDGEYTEGYAWNGLTTVTDSPTGAESNKQYADNGVYANLKSVEEAGFTIEAFTCPRAFGRADGSAEPVDGLFINQQGRETFGFSYRTLIGNDLEGQDHGYKIRLVWGCDAAPSEKAAATVNDSPELAALSWEITTTSTAMTSINPATGKVFKPTASMTLDSTLVDADALADLEDILYGTVGEDPRLPTPDEVFELFDAVTITEVNLATPANQPVYNSSTHVVTLPAVTGIQWKIGGVNKANGVQPALTVGQTANITAHPTAGYVLTDESDSDWSFAY